MPRELSPQREARRAARKKAHAQFLETYDPPYLCFICDEQIESNLQVYSTSKLFEYDVKPCHAGCLHSYHRKTTRAESSQVNKEAWANRTTTKGA
jgi:hypothetical protein